MYKLQLLVYNKYIKSNKEMLKIELKLEKVAERFYWVDENNNIWDADIINKEEAETASRSTVFPNIK